MIPSSIGLSEETTLLKGVVDIPWDVSRKGLV